MTKLTTTTFVKTATWLRAMKDERGAGMAEYTLLLVLVAIALLVIFGQLADAIRDALQTVIDALGEDGGVDGGGDGT